MRYILIIKVLLFYINLESLYAQKWDYVTKGINGHDFYVLGNEVEERDKYIYFWQLIDYSTFDEYGDSSAKIFIMGDCNNLKFKWLKIAYHKENMAKDNSRLQVPSKIISGWQYPELNTTSRLVLEFACKRKILVL